MSFLSKKNIRLKDIYKLSIDSGRIQSQEKEQILSKGNFKDKRESETEIEYIRELKDNYEKIRLSRSPKKVICPIQLSKILNIQPTGISNYSIYEFDNKERYEELMEELRNELKTFELQYHIYVRGRKNQHASYYVSEISSNSPDCVVLEILNQSQGLKIERDGSTSLAHRIYEFSFFRFADSDKLEKVNHERIKV
ncbi:MAG: hypothetical protein AAGA77_24975 [Bacteroidota bacterium]